jgi:hypothetical protein
MALLGFFFAIDDGCLDCCDVSFLAMSICWDHCSELCDLWMVSIVLRMVLD